MSHSASEVSAVRISAPTGGLILDFPATLPEGVSAAEFREALSNALTPVTILATDGPAGRAGVTCSAVCSVCDTPPTILVCVNRKSYANGVIKTNGVLTVNWLSAAQSELSQVFAGVGALSMDERFSCAEWGRLASGAPYCTDAVLSFDCSIASAVEIGTHTVILARVLASATAARHEPLGYCRRGYATTCSTQS